MKLFLQGFLTCFLICMSIFLFVLLPKLDWEPGITIVNPNNYESITCYGKVETITRCLGEIRRITNEPYIPDGCRKGAGPEVPCEIDPEEREQWYKEGCEGD